MDLDRDIRTALIAGSNDDVLNAAWAALDFAKDLERPTIGGQDPAWWARAFAHDIRTRMAKVIGLTVD